MTGQGQLQGRNICFYLDTLTGTSGATSDQPPATQSPSRAHKFPHHLSSGFRPMPTLVSLAGGSPFTGTPQEPCRVTNCTPSSSSDILRLCCPCPWIMSGEPPTGFKGYEVGGWRRLISRSGQESFSAGLPVHIGMKVALLLVTQSYTLESQHQGSFHCPSMASSIFFSTFPKRC